jgi:hypothetical protein
MKSWVGMASRDFAAPNGSTIQIIEGRQLKYMLKEHLGLSRGTHSVPAGVLRDHPEHPPHVVIVHRRSHRRREHQPVILP